MMVIYNQIWGVRKIFQILLNAYFYMHKAVFYISMGIRKIT
jgi:hypothetical protein